jgi:hypothetical protein
MANLKLKNPGGGSLNLVSADSASDLTVTFPATTGTAMVSGNMPAFSAYKSTTQSISSGSFVKVLLETEEFDTNNNFASSRFTPTVAGYYQVSGRIDFAFTGSSVSLSIINKSGSTYKLGSLSIGTNSGCASAVSCLVYLNGSTDYIELFGFQNTGSSQDMTASQSSTYLQASMVRAA